MPRNNAYADLAEYFADRKFLTREQCLRLDAWTTTHNHRVAEMLCQYICSQLDQWQSTTPWMCHGGPGCQDCYA